MNVTHARDSCQTPVGNQSRVTAGVTLKAAEALTDPGRQYFTREQVACLIHLAFLSGAEHRRAFDTAELIATWDANTTPRRTRQQRVDWELAQHAEQAELRRLRERPHGQTAVSPVQPVGLDDYGNVVPVGQTPNPECGWPAVAQPGQPGLRVAA